MKVLYLAHPVSENPRANAVRVVDWIRWLTNQDLGYSVVAPWLGQVLAFQHLRVRPGDAFYERALAEDIACVEKLDGVIAMGGDTPGMRREMDAARALGLDVIDLRAFNAPFEIEDLADVSGMSVPEYIETYRNIQELIDELEAAEWDEAPTNPRPAGVN